MPPTARRGETNTGTQHRLAGLHGIVRALAVRAKVPEITGATVQDIRQHFIHIRNLRSAAAKRRVFAMCQRLGWEPADDNAADALAAWSYGCALVHPITALQTTPLAHPNVNSAGASLQQAIVQINLGLKASPLNK